MNGEDAIPKERKSVGLVLMIKEWWARTFWGGGGASWCVLLEIGFCYFQSEEILEIASSLMENIK